MALLKSDEDQHKGNLTKLIEEFGKNMEDKIREIYRNKRIYLESSDVIQKGFVPIVMYTYVRNILLKMDKEPNSNEYVPR